MGNFKPILPEEMNEILILKRKWYRNWDKPGGKKHALPLAHKTIYLLVSYKALLTEYRKLEILVADRAEWQEVALKNLTKFENQEAEHIRLFAAVEAFMWGVRDTPVNELSNRMRKAEALGLDATNLSSLRAPGPLDPPRLPPGGIKACIDNEEIVNHADRDAFHWCPEEIKAFDALSEQLLRSKKRVAELEVELNKVKDWITELTHPEFGHHTQEIGEKDERIEKLEAEIRERAEKDELSKVKEENEIMSTEEWSCKIDVPDPETASYLVTLLTCAYPGNTEVDLTTSDRIRRFFPGGFEAVEKMSLGLNKKRYRILRDLEVKLKPLGIWTGNNSPAPWVEVEAPTNIKGVPIDYLGKQGIKVGSDVISLEEMKAAVKKCEED